MKTFNIFLAVVLAFCSLVVNAQTKQVLKQESVKVYGNCEMCKARIEKAARAAGATSAKWNVDSKMLAVSYAPAKTSVAKIEKSVAAAGYDTGSENAGEEAYKKLPECCQYDRKPAEETKKN